MNAAHDRYLELASANCITPAYVDLVQLLSDDEPKAGFVRADEVRPLTEKEVQTVYRARPVDMNDEFCRDFEIGDFMTENPLVLAARFAFRREQAARRVVFFDVQEECERRATFAAWDAVR